MFGVIVVVVLLNGDICEVNKRVVDVAHVSVVLGVTEACKAVNILVSFQRPIVKDKN